MSLSIDSLIRRIRFCCGCVRIYGYPDGDASDVRSRIGNFSISQRIDSSCMRMDLGGLGVLTLAGCATSPYAEVWYKKPQLTGPRGPEPLATVEHNFTEAMREDRAHLLFAMPPCRVALKSGSYPLEVTT